MLELNKIHQGDCLKIMRQLPDKCIDLLVTDPPYGIGETWSKSRKDRFYKKGSVLGYKNKAIPGAATFREMFRVSKNQIIFGGNYYTKYLPPTNAWIIWDKDRNADNTFMSEGEMAWTSFKKVLRIKQFIWDGARKCENVVKIHPHQKPVKLMKWIVYNYSKEDDLILDPYSGSGSTLVACKDLRRNYIGIEKELNYVKDSNQRLLQEILI